MTAVEVTASNVHDSQVLPGLLNRTAQRFAMAEVSADKAYLSEVNLRHIQDHGAHPYIPFKSNTTGQGEGEGHGRSSIRGNHMNLGGPASSGFADGLGVCLIDRWAS